MPAFYKSNPSQIIIENVELTVRSLSEDPVNEKAATEDDNSAEKKEELNMISVIFYYLLSL